MKQYKVILMVAICICFVSSALADSVIQPKFVNIRITRASLSISGSVASCAGGVWAYSSSSPCSVTIKLQKSYGTGWITIRSFYASGSGSAAGSNTYSITAGTYRVAVSGNVNGEMFLIYSPTKTMN